MTIDHPDVRLVQRVCARDAEAIEAIVPRLLPIIHVRVARAMVANPHTGGEGRDLRIDVEDMTQEVLAMLFEDDAKVLARWTPERGLSLSNFVGLVAQRWVRSLMLSRRQNPWFDRVTEPETLMRSAGAQLGDLDDQLAAKQALHIAMKRSDAEVSVLGSRLLELFFAEGCSNEEVQERTGLSNSAVYKWRSRLRLLIRRHLGAVLEEEV